MARLFAVLIMLLIGMPIMAKANQPSQPNYNANDWNFILVPSFEHDPNSFNLTVNGLNQSLRFAQVLALQTTGQQQSLRQILAFLPQPAQAPLTPGATPVYLAPLQSIEPFALLTNQSVAVNTVTVEAKSGPPTPPAYGTAGYWAQQILHNSPRGIYVIGLPPDLMGAVVQALTGASIPTPPPPNLYWVVSGSGTHLTAHSYSTNANNNSTFPTVTLPPASKSCPQDPVTFTIPAPSGLNPYPNRTVTFVRHVEAHPTSSFENGNYICQGQWRALGSVPILEKMLHIAGKSQIADAVISSDPNNLISCTGTCSYIRPLLTVTPFAIKQKLPVTVAPFQWTDYVDLAHWLFNPASPYAVALPPLPTKDPQSLLVGWEHGNLMKTVKYLISTVYQQPEKAGDLPDWSFTDYDSVWTVSTDAKGNLTFSNSCEHIPTASLPGTCPAFLP